MSLTFLAHAMLTALIIFAIIIFAIGAASALLSVGLGAALRAIDCWNDRRRASNDLERLIKSRQQEAADNLKETQPADPVTSELWMKTISRKTRDL